MDPTVVTHCETYQRKHNLTVAKRKYVDKLARVPQLQGKHEENPK